MIVKRVPFRVLTAVLLLSPVSACGGSQSDFCSGVKSVADFTNRFSLGLDNFSENEYSQLRLDSLDTYDIVMEAVRNDDKSGDAVQLSLTLKKFIGEMNKLNWDVTRAIEDPDAVEAATEIGSSQSLVRANSVEAYVIDQCGLPSTLPITSTVDTLPMPSVPGLTDTEPPRDTIDQDSEHYATGILLGTIYGLELSQFEAICLGRKLDGVVDVTSSTATSDLYVAQFQNAFDDCDVPFTIPSQ